MIEVRPITSAKLWDGYVATRPFSQFLQSWAWGEFQRAVGRKIARIGCFDGDRLVGAAQLVAHRLPLGRRYFYLPRGPVLSDPLNQAVNCALQRALVELAGKEAALAIRIEPPVESGQTDLPCFDLGYRRVADLQPSVTRVLDLAKPLDELRARLHPKTRYNIGLAERKGVTVHDRTDQSGLDVFLRLQAETALRDKIRPFPDGYFRTMERTLAPAGLLRVLIAEHDGTPLSAMILIRYGDTVTYNHGASSDLERHLMAPHLLQWKAIERARADGFRVYDFRGIAPTDDPDHPWAGITRFKAGFGGRVVRLAGTLDLPLRKSWYWLYRAGQLALRQFR